jgi:DNA polymerase-4
MDVTENHKGMASATLIAQEIKRKIVETTHLTASAGVSFNKFLAKIASDQNKPDGLFVVKPGAAELFVESLAIEQFFGVGKVTAKLMHQMGIRTGRDLKQRSENELVSVFGKAGHIYYQNARAIDVRPVESQRIRKSISSETTFDRDIDNPDELALALDAVARDAFEDIDKKKFRGRTVTLKIKYADFKVITRSKTFVEAVSDYDSFYKAGFELLQLADLSPKVRLIGLGLKNSDDETGWHDAIQLCISFEEDEQKGW